MAKPAGSTPTIAQAQARTAWDRQYAALRAHLRSNDGRYPVYSARGTNGLYQWVGKQRKSYAVSGSISKTRFVAAGRDKQMEKLPGWQWTQNNAKWDVQYAALRAFLDSRDGRYPSNTASIAAESTLGGWVNRQRMNYSGHGAHATALTKANFVAAGRDKRLEELPGWWWSKQTTWEEQYAALRVHLKSNAGRYPVVNVATEKSLYNWVHTQRRNYADTGTMSKAGFMAAARDTRLEELPGWLWSGSRPTGATTGDANGGTGPHRSAMEAIVERSQGSDGRNTPIAATARLSVAREQEAKATSIGSTRRVRAPSPGARSAQQKSRHPVLESAAPTKALLGAVARELGQPGTASYAHVLRIFRGLFVGLWVQLHNMPLLIAQSHK